MIDKATFGGGCFWGVEARFRELPGVIDTQVGYMGGHTEHPTYEQVCTGQTGHAEVVEVRYDVTRVDYETLVGEFFKLHDPTQVDRQGPDVGRQYRSVIFAHDDQQHELARRSRDRLQAAGSLPGPIATAIEPATQFWRAEEYHQQYLARRGGTCPV